MLVIVNTSKQASDGHIFLKMNLDYILTVISSDLMFVYLEG